MGLLPGQILESVVSTQTGLIHTQLQILEEKPVKTHLSSVYGIE